MRPKLYIMCKSNQGVIDDSTISPNIRTDGSAHVARRHTMGRICFGPNHPPPLGGGRPCHGLGATWAGLG